MASSGGKSLAVGHISGFQIDPKILKKDFNYLKGMEVINWPNEKVDKTVDKIKKDSSSNSLELLDANAKNDDFSLQASHTPE